MIDGQLSPIIDQNLSIYRCILAISSTGLLWELQLDLKFGKDALVKYPPITVLLIFCDFGYETLRSFPSIFCHPEVPKIVYFKSPGMGICILMLAQGIVIQVGRASSLLFKRICDWEKISSCLSVSMYSFRILHLCLVGNQGKAKVQFMGHSDFEVHIWVCH